MDTSLERFNAKYKIDKNTGCWNWIAAIRGECGYGCMFFRGKVQSAHRISFILFKGEITNGLLILHSCDNRKCVNPNHLSTGTAKMNALDRMERGNHTNAGRIKETMSKYIVHPSISQYDKGCRCNGCKLKKKEANAKYKK